MLDGIGITCMCRWPSSERNLFYLVAKGLILGRIIERSKLRLFSFTFFLAAVRQEMAQPSRGYAGNFQISKTTITSSWCVGNAPEQHSVNSEERLVKRIKRKRSTSGVGKKKKGSPCKPVAGE